MLETRILAPSNYGHTVLHVVCLAELCFTHYIVVFVYENSTICGVVDVR